LRYLRNSKWCQQRKCEQWCPVHRQA
jgi:hypothetical protein